MFRFLFRKKEIKSTFEVKNSPCITNDADKDINNIINELDRAIMDELFSVSKKEKRTATIEDARSILQKITYDLRSNTKKSDITQKIIDIFERNSQPPNLPNKMIGDLI